MPEEILYSAAEIAAMNLPGLPTTKGKILARAEKEDWYCETRLGLGGVRKVFKIPATYLNLYQVAEATPGYIDQGTVSKKPEEGRQSGQVVGAIAGGEQIDSQRLASAIRALDEFLAENKLVINDPARKAEIVTFLYKYLEKRASQNDVNDLLRLVTG